MQKLVRATLTPLSTLSSSAQKEPAEVSEQPITGHDSQTHLASAASAAPETKEKPEEPEGASVEPQSAVQVPSKQTNAVPEVQPEHVGSPEAPQRQQEGEEPPQISHKCLLEHQELVREAEKELWATVEETAAEGGKERSEEEEEEEKREEEGGGVTGG